ncbi:hypothetical protein DAPPUDRAFT_193845 [Daphnia pulex]|uniref:Kinesin motor domain-containing protein n=1 Tax=Daphnia pulex TaxID=6669 RepID=E9G4J8_DAPPU|nr:hypothetical protein DAPPUDRAFT_193845 [Daphnia pulex]|eukprot:EFX85549.1 hypothetical protein DAPPUDRAFT_193845 [Daphnia pulex]
MMGKIGSKSELDDASGIIPRSSTSTICLSIEIQISYFQIYKEKIQDLLCSTRRNLSVRKHPKNGPYVVNLTNCLVTSLEEVQRWLAVGNRKRVVASTSQNEHSSRSHIIFSITLSQSFQEIIDGRPHVTDKHSRINFIDLAEKKDVVTKRPGYSL